MHESVLDNTVSPSSAIGRLPIINRKRPFPAETEKQPDQPLVAKERKIDDNSKDTVEFCIEAIETDQSAIEPQGKTVQNWWYGYGK